MTREQLKEFLEIRIWEIENCLALRWRSPDNIEWLTKTLEINKKLLELVC